MDWEAKRSIRGLVPLSLHPYTPTESQLMSSTVIKRRFVLGGVWAKRPKVNA